MSKFNSSNKSESESVNNNNSQGTTAAAETANHAKALGQELTGSGTTAKGVSGDKAENKENNQQVGVPAMIDLDVRLVELIKVRNNYKAQINGLSYISNVHNTSILGVSGMWYIKSMRGTKLVYIYIIRDLAKAQAYVEANYAEKFAGKTNIFCMEAQEYDFYFNRNQPAMPDSPAGEEVSIESLLALLKIVDPDCTLMSRLTHIDKKGTGKFLILKTQGIEDNKPCNGNDVNGIFTNGWEFLGTSLSPVKYKPGSMGPSLQLTGAEYKQGSTSILKDAQISFGATQFRAYCLPYGVTRKSLAFFSLAATIGWELSNHNNGRQVYALFDVLIEGKSGRPSIKDPTKKGVPSDIASHRSKIRSILLKGENPDEQIASVSRNSRERNGQKVTVYQPLLQKLNENQGQISEFIIIAEVIEEEQHDKQEMNAEGKLVTTEQQTRVYCSDMAVVHITRGAEIINPDPVRLNKNNILRTEYFSFLGGGTVKVAPTQLSSGAEALKKDLKLTKPEPELDVLAGKIPVANLIEQTAPPAQLVIPRGQIPQTVYEVVTKTLEDAPAPQAEEPIGELASELPELELDEETECVLGDELKLLYEYQNNLAKHHALRPRTQVDVMELVTILTGGSKADKVALYQKIYPTLTVPQLEKKLAEAKHGAYVADALRAFVLMHTDPEFKDPYQPYLGGYNWNQQDIKDWVFIIHALIGDSGVAGNKETVFEFINTQKTADGSLLLMIGGEALFKVTSDLIAYDARRGRAFTNQVVISNVGIKSINGSMSNFMHTLFYTFCPIFAANFGHTIWDNLGASIFSIMSKVPELNCITEDNVLEQNGAAQFSMKATYVPVCLTNFPVVDHQGWINISSGKSSIGAKALIKVYSAEYLRTIKAYEWIKAVKAAMGEALVKYQLDFHYANKVFKVSYIGHGNFTTLEFLAPTLSRMVMAYVGVAHGDVDNKLIVYSTKVSKGLKRGELSHAHSANLEKPVEAGWIRYGQETVMTGFPTQAVMALSVTSAPGMGAWVGLREDLPVAVVTKGVCNIAKNDFVIDKKTKHPFNLTASNIKDMQDIGYTQVVGEDGWNYLTFDRPVQVKGDRSEIICTVNKKEKIMFDCSGQINHERIIQGCLVGIKWKEVTTIVSGVTQLKVEYEVAWTERYPKFRSINKGNFMESDRYLYLNELNKGKFDKVGVNAIYFQDTIKAITFSWLMVAGNTILHNYLAGCNQPEFHELYKEARRINQKLGAPWQHDKPQLCIEPNAVFAGVYNKLLELFVRSFAVRDTWIMFDQAPLQARMMTEWVQVMLSQGKWVAVDLTTEPELLANLELKPLEEGQNWQVYREAGDWNWHTNVLTFIHNAAGEPIAHAQRSTVLIGKEGMPLYNVELFESSTVKENLGGSNILYESIKSLSFVLQDKELLQTIQHRLIREGEENMLRLKYLTTMTAGHTFGVKRKNLVEVMISGTELSITPNSRAYLLRLLKEAGIHISLDMKAKHDDTFAKVCGAFQGIIFQLAPSGEEGDTGIDYYYSGYMGGEEEEPQYIESSKTTIWMPAMLSFSKLTSKSDSNQDFVACWYHEILLPLLFTGVAPKQRAAIFKGVVKSLLDSENTIKLGNGGRNTGYKRIGLPNLPVGRLVVEVQKGDGPEVTNSLWQELVRSGVPMDKLLADGGGEDVYGVVNRAPLAAGALVLIQGAITLPNGQQYLVPLKQDLDENGECEGILGGKVPLRYRVSPVQGGRDIWTVYLDQGDFDGDTEYFTYLPEITDRKYLTTYEDVARIQAAALGQDMWTSGALAADHFKIKKFTDVANTLGWLVSNKDGGEDYVDISATLKGLVKTHDEYVDYNQWAYYIQICGVGTMYSVYMLGDTIVEMAQILKKYELAIPLEMRPLVDSKADPESIVLVVSTLYEVLLGGYEPAAKGLCTFFLDRISAGEADLDLKYDPDNKTMVNIRTRNITELVKVLEGLGSNPDRAEEVYALMKYTAKIYRYMRHEDGVPPATDSKQFNPADFHHWGTLATTVFEFTRGKFVGFNGMIRQPSKKRLYQGHRGALLRSFALLDKLEANGLGHLIKESVTLHIMSLIKYHLEEELVCNLVETPKVGLAQGDCYGITWKQDEIDFFLDQLPSNKPRALYRGEVELITPEILLTLDGNNSTHAALGEFIECRKLTPSAEVVSQCIKRLDRLNQEKQEVVTSILEGYHVFLSGKPGAGKSYTIQQVRDIFCLLGVGHIVVGSTGISVMTIKGDATFNAFFGLGFGFEENKDTPRKRSGFEWLVTKIKTNKKVKQRLGELARLNKGFCIPLIIDEVSMCESLLLTAVDLALEEMEVSVQNIQVGDPLQLEPVEGALFYKDVVLPNDKAGATKPECSVYSLHTVYGEEFLRFELQQNQRAAKDPVFCAALDQLRIGEGIAPALAARINYSQDHQDEIPANATYIVQTNAQVMEINRERTTEMIAAGATAKTYQAIVNTTDPLYGEKWYLNKEGEFLFAPLEYSMTFCIGMPVMMKKNLYAEGVLETANSTPGVVEELGEDFITVRDKFGNLVKVVPVELPVDKFLDEAPGTVKQLPVHPAFAITVAKSQGQTIKGPIALICWHQNTQGKVSPCTRNNSHLVQMSRGTSLDNLWFVMPKGDLPENFSLLKLIAKGYKTNMESVLWLQSKELGTPVRKVEVTEEAKS